MLEVIHVEAFKKLVDIGLNVEITHKGENLLHLILEIMENCSPCIMVSLNPLIIRDRLNSYHSFYSNINDIISTGELVQNLCIFDRSSRFVG